MIRTDQARKGAKERRRKRKDKIRRYRHSSYCNRSYLTLSQKNGKPRENGGVKQETKEEKRQAKV